MIYSYKKIGRVSHPLQYYLCIVCTFLSCWGMPLYLTVSMANLWAFIITFNTCISTQYWLKCKFSCHSILCYIVDLFVCSLFFLCCPVVDLMASHKRSCSGDLYLSNHIAFQNLGSKTELILATIIYLDPFPWEDLVHQKCTVWKYIPITYIVCWYKNLHQVEPVKWTSNTTSCDAVS